MYNHPVILKQQRTIKYSYYPTVVQETTYFRIFLSCIKTRIVKPILYHYFDELYPEMNAEAFSVKLSQP